MTQPAEDSLTEYVEAALKTARRVIRRGRKAKKTLDSIRHLEVDPGNVDQFAQVRDAVGELIGKTDCPELDRRLGVWHEASAQPIEEAAEVRQRELLTEIRDEAASREISVEKLGDRPPTLALGTFRVEVEASSHIRLKVGLEPIVDVEPVSETVFETCEDILASWEERTPDAPELFERIRRAYLMACSLTGKSPEDRVDIVDLLAPLALLESGDDALRKRGIDTTREYPRHLLARQLAVLNRERMLEHQNWRLDLGAATGGSTRDKRDVLYVQTAPNRGQYFLSIRFTRTR